MRLFWAILLFATQFERCAAPVCELFPYRDRDVEIARQLGIRDLRAVLPLAADVILVSGFDNLPGTNDERILWRWSEARGLEEIRRFTEYEVEDDKLTRYGESGWYYSFERDDGVHVFTDTDQTHFFEVPRPYPMFHYPLRAGEPRILVVNYLTDDRMGAVEVGVDGTPRRRWTFPAAPRRTTVPDQWSAILLDDQRIALLAAEIGYTQTSPWRLILRILGDGEAVEEHVLREQKPSITASFAVRGSTFAVVSRGSSFQYSIFDLADVANAEWREVTLEPQSAMFPQIVATQESFIAAWTVRPPRGDWQIRAVDLPGGVFARTIAPLLGDRDRIYLTLRDDRTPLLIYGNPDVRLRELSEPLSGMELLEHICDRFAAWRSSD